jgi:glycosyltransferase
MCRFSIITCIKNSSNTVRETIKSLELQDFNNYEHLFIDGGSLDNSIDICVKANNSKIYVKPNLNLYEALNFGVEKATGDIIFFLHSDDQIIDKKFLKNISEIFDQKKIHYIYSNIVMKKNNKIYRLWKSKNLSKEDISYFQFPAHTSFCYKKEVFEHIGLFNTKYKIASDFHHLARLFNSKLDNYFYDKLTISMNYGGISTKSFRNIFYQNYENYKIIREYNYDFYQILKVYLKKILNRVNQINFFKVTL